MQKKKYKMISINYTNECFKKPRCSFCYLKKEKIINKLMKTENRKDIWSMFAFTSDSRMGMIKETKQVAIAYNGVEIHKLIRIIEACAFEDVIVNITTNPDFVTSQIAGLFQRLGIKMVALSLDSEKCGASLKNWTNAAELLQEKGIKIGANILMLDEMFGRISKVLKVISSFCHQIHLLRPKFYKTEIPERKRLAMIFLLKSQYSNLFIDQCFRFELLKEPCTRGKDFISLNADGSVSLCSFDLYRNNLKNLKKCPYI